MADQVPQNDVARAPAPRCSLLAPLVAGLLLLLLGFGIWRWMDGGTPSVSGDGATNGRPAETVAVPQAPQGQAAEQQYLSGVVQMRAVAGAQVRDWPSESSGNTVRTIPATSDVVGRWVRGADGRSRWLRLTEGGFVSAAALNEPAPTAPPIQISVSNRNCEWGADFDRYYARASEIKRQAEQAQGNELESVVVRVPRRPWRGLTVTGVEAQYEGSAIIFAEPIDRVRGVLTESGVTIAADGNIPLADDGENVAIQSLQTTQGGTTRYGATALVCGV